MNLSKALRARPHSRIAFSGAGGKTTAIFMLARELLAASQRIYVTTTTHFSSAQLRLADHHLPAASPTDLLLPDAAAGVILVTSGRVAGDRVSGVEEEVLAALRKLAEAAGAPLLIEGDGSRMHPAKAPAAHEPAVPDFVDAVVVTAGLSVLGRPLTDKWVHRPAIFSALSGTSPGKPVTLSGLVKVLGHPEGGLKGIPQAARKILLLNQADTENQLSQGGRMAEELLGAYDSVVLAALESALPVRSVREPVAAVVLAAGGSRRMGTAKQLLDWQGRPLVVHAAETALAAGCRPVIVVTGAEAEVISRSIAGLSVTQVYNKNWRNGQSTSVQAGLQALPAQTGAVIFMLVDQPFVNAALVRALIDAHSGSLAPIVAPLIDGQRGNPVLFDRETFPDFAGLTGDIGGRTLFSRHRSLWVPWHDRRALRDVDSPADYEESIRVLDPSNDEN